MVHIPSEVAPALEIIQDSFKDSLLAVYLHGSATLGGLRPKSDVDLLAITDRPMTPEMRENLTQDLLRISGSPERGDPVRPLELIVFNRDDLPAYPARVNYLYGEWLRKEFEAGKMPQPFVSPGYAIVIEQARQLAIPLIGPPPQELLPKVADAHIRDATGKALQPLIDDVVWDQRNVLLTLTRMWRTLITGDFVPKDVAADWAMSRLSNKSCRLVALAREAYLGLTQDDWKGRDEDVQRAAQELGYNIKKIL